MWTNKHPVIKIILEKGPHIVASAKRFRYPKGVVHLLQADMSIHVDGNSNISASTIWYVRKHVKKATLWQLQRNIQEAVKYIVIWKIQVNQFKYKSMCNCFLACLISWKNFHFSV